MARDIDPRRLIAAHAAAARFYERALALYSADEREERADVHFALGRALTAASTNAPVYNVCTGKGTTVRVLAETMAELLRAELVAYRRPARSGEVRVSIGDARRAAEQLGFVAETTLADGLAITLAVPRSSVGLESRVIA